MPTQTLAEIKQKLSGMRQNLERWKSHNEVNAKPADGLLYEFLRDFLSIFENAESDCPQIMVEAEEESALQSNESEEDKSQINATFDATDDAADTGGSAPPPEKGRG